MAGMNINDLRKAVLLGQIATLTAQIRVWEIYGERTGEVVTTIITSIETHIAALQAIVDAI